MGLLFLVMGRNLVIETMFAVEVGNGASLLIHGDILLL